jgi:ribonuclease HII
VEKGDNTYRHIAAASILAKTYHDEYIREMVRVHPTLERYGLLKNMGYGTKDHIEAIHAHGISPFHRKSFGICKQYRGPKRQEPATGDDEVDP